MNVIVDCAAELPGDLGPGLLETVYEVTLARALERRGLCVERQVGVAIEYRGETFDEGFRTINRNLDCDPPCLGASVREEPIAQSAGANGQAPVAQPQR